MFNAILTEAGYFLLTSEFKKRSAFFLWQTCSREIKKETIIFLGMWHDKQNSLTVDPGWTARLHGMSSIPEVICFLQRLFLFYLETLSLVSVSLRSGKERYPDKSFFL